MKYQIILLNAANEQGTIIAAEATLAVATIKYLLLDAGLKDIAVFPDEEEVNIVTLESMAEEFISGNAADIYGISTHSGSYTAALIYSKLIRKYHPKTLIAGGGVHFISTPNIEKALYSRSFDIVFKGGCGAFIDFCSDIFLKKNLEIRKTESSISIFGKLPAGAHLIRDGKISSNGSGKLERGIVPVMHITDEYAEITVLFNDRCANNCDYCTVFKTGETKTMRAETEKHTQDAYIQLKSITDGPFKISIMDSSPFSKANRAETFKTVKQLGKLDENIRFSLFADPDDFDGELADFADSHQISTFFIGRDRIREDPFIGRKLRGILRSKEQLVSEREKLKTFIKESANKKRDIFIGYIASPYDTAADACELISEIEDFTALSGNCTVQPDLFILNPYVGTAVYDRSAEAAWDISEFSYPYPNVWCGADVQMVWLELIRLLVSPVFSTGTAADIGIYLLKLTKYLAFGGDLYDYDGRLPVINKITQRIVQMNLGSEKSFEDWQRDLEEVYHLGLVIVALLKNPSISAKYKLIDLSDYIKKHDIMINALRADFNVIRSKKADGTWYGRFVF
ncbi:MAG: hypothetical protein LBD73_03405 [Deferribacteraceae bacterium]|jgi:hypothetical protein|nr:hypothetical protein [Deferribacteraceae bacterium]